VLFVSYWRKPMVGEVIDVRAPRSLACPMDWYGTYRIMAHKTFPSTYQLSFVLAGDSGHTPGTALLLDPSRCFHRVDQVE